MAGKIPEHIIQEIKNRLSIREVVSDYVTLTRDGANYKALCPFHREKTPSFKVHEGMGIFRCFGCGESGNVFSFLMKIEGISFAEALTRLAARAGVEIPKPERSQDEKKQEEKREQIFRANELAEAFYQRILWESEEGEKAREYLANRGLNREWAEKFRLGFAPDAWDELLRHLRSRDLKDAIIHEAGLIIPRESGGYYDRFRNRLIFSIRDVSGRVRGFGARVLDDSLPKYINSPETPVYKKGEGFYGIDLAKDKIRQADRAVIVEGYFDRIRLAMAGIEYALASLGTAFTAQQARLIRRYTRNVFTVFDTDLAGLKASLRALEAFLEEGVTPRIVLLPEGKDPDEFVANSSGEDFLQLLEQAPSLVDFFIEQELAGGSGTPAETAQAVQRIALVLSKIRDPIERSLYVKKLAERLGIPLVEIQRKLLRPVAKQDEKEGKQEGEAGLEEGRFAKEEEELLALLLHYPEIGPQMEREKAVELFASPELASFMKRLLSQIEKKGCADPGLILHEVRDENIASLVARLALEKERHQPDLVDAILSDCIRGLHIGHLRHEKARVQREIHEAERNQQSDRLHQLLLEKDRLLKKERELRAASITAR
jgi:DNA primase